MPYYDFYCKVCGATAEEFRLMSEHDAPMECACGAGMTRDFVAEGAAVRGDYKHPIVSEALAFDAIDLAEHRAMYPDIDVEVDGRFARPILRSLSQKRAYLKGRGHVDTKSFV